MFLIKQLYSLNKVLAMNISELNNIMNNVKSIRFIGIGGVSMSSIALIAHNNGFIVTGYDRDHTPVTDKIEDEGITVDYLPNIDALSKTDAVVYTAAMSFEHEEMAYAQSHNIPLIKRAEFLGYIMQHYKNRIGVAGMHGKSTTTSMLSQVFMECNTNPTIVNGAQLKILEGGTYRVGSNDNFIFEACEYKDSFLSFLPSIAVVLNIDRDHVDYFKSMAQTIRSFKSYINLADTAVVNWDDPNTRLACKGYKGNLIKIGINSKNLDYSAKNIAVIRGKCSFDAYHGKDKLGRIVLNVPGEHMVLDALVSVACAHISGLNFTSVQNALYDFVGACRRFEFKGRRNNIDVYDDYAHHPSEITATLSGVSKLGYKKVYVIFQPHTYSRTAGLFEEFSKAFTDCDEVILCDIYAAREINTFGVSSQKLAKAVGSKAKYFDSFDNITDYLKQNAKSGDLILTMGAGLAYKIGEDFLK